MSRFEGDHATQLVKSRPIEVYWQGWRTDTLTLQREGWEFAAHFQHDIFMMNLVMRNQDLRLSAWFEDYRYDRNSIYLDNMNELAPLYINRIAPNIQVCRINTQIDFSDAKLLDMERQYSTMSEVKSIEDMIPFAGRVEPPGVQEVILESKADMEVVDHLQAILEEQEERQAEIRRRRLNNSKQVQPESEIKQREVKFRVVQ